MIVYVTFNVLILLSLGSNSLKPNTVTKNSINSFYRKSIFRSSERKNELSTIETESELNTLIKKMPTNEKYSLLLQSYGRKILDTKNKDESSSNLLDKMEFLYLEMIQQSIKPEEKSIMNIIDASASFCNVDRISRTIKILKTGIIYYLYK